MDEYDDWGYVEPEDLWVPECRMCGRELTMGSELLDDLCCRCFQMGRYGRLLSAAEMGLPAVTDAS